MKFYMILDGQWGSSGKGLLAGYLAKRRRPDVAVCNFGPNAGHTYCSKADGRVMLQQLPMAVIAPTTRVVLIGPGAVVDPGLLVSEIKATGRNYPGRHWTLRIHPRAAVVLEHNRTAEESQLVGISSTLKGTGHAVTDKIMRRQGATISSWITIRGTTDPNATFLSGYLCSQEEYDEILANAELIQVESAQGLELSLNQGNSYPYCTGRDVTPAQVMADCGLNPRWEYETIVAMRTFPIRVGGPSGPFYQDQWELTWDEVGVPAEKTTVTGKVRRVATWSKANLAKVLRVCDPDRLFVNFMNYLPDNEAAADGFVEKVAKQMVGHRANISWLGWGPNDEDVMEVDNGGE